MSWSSPNEGRSRKEWKCSAICSEKVVGQESTAQRLNSRVIGLGKMTEEWTCGCSFPEPVILWGPALVAAGRKERREQQQKKTQGRMCFNHILFIKPVVYFSAINPASYSGKCQSIVSRSNKTNYFGTQSTWNNKGCKLSDSQHPATSMNCIF